MWDVQVLGLLQTNIRCFFLGMCFVLVCLREGRGLVAQAVLSNHLFQSDTLERNGIQSLF